MNVIYLHAHDAGRYVQPYGYPVETSHLMRFAKEGVLFRKAFCAAPTCGPSRAALMSGQTPHQIGMLGLPGSQGWKFDDYSKHLSHQFRAAGFDTILAGCQHECDHADLGPLGYDRYLDLEAPSRTQAGEFYPETINKVEAFLATRKRDGGGRPFFLSIGTDEPHRDNLSRQELDLVGLSERFSKTRKYDPGLLDFRYTAPPPWLPDLPELRKDMESYREGVRVMDEYFGRVFYALDQSGVSDDTLVIVTSDHGIEFPGGKKTLGDQGTQVMLILRGPKGSEISGGIVLEPMVTHLDIYPTLVELCGLQPAHTLEGKSLMPLIRGEVSSLHDAIFAEQTYHCELEAIRSVRTERYKYIRRRDPIAHKMSQDGPSGRILRAMGWYRRETGHEELYDLYLDPWEACNRIIEPDLQLIRYELSLRLDNWMRATGDFFADDTYPLPANAG